MPALNNTQMSKKDISKILEKGSGRQRVLLLSEDIARSKFDKERLLADQDFKALFESIKNPKDIKIYNRFKLIDNTVNNAVHVLNEHRIALREHAAILRGYCLLWDGYQRTEEMINLILHENKNIRERKSIVEKVLKVYSKDFNSPFALLAKSSVDPEGYLNIDIETTGRPKKSKSDKGLLTLHNVMWVTEKKIREMGVRCITYAQAILDFMDESGYKVKTYQIRINELLDDVYEDKALWHKYSSKYFDAKDESGDLLFLRRSDRLRYNFTIFPDMSALMVDKALYDQFKIDYLGHE